MQTLIATLRPVTAFGGPIRGDTLFGQLCWAARHRYGEDRLDEWLQGYTNGAPFIVVSDAFPAGYLPRPALPLHRFETVPDTDRKAVKKRKWLPRQHFAEPIANWLGAMVAEAKISKEHDIVAIHSQPHNTLNRMTGTTGTGEFAPYAISQHWFAPGLDFDLYIAYDEQQIDSDAIKTLLADIGLTGYGRDASIGLGKFEVKSCDHHDWPSQEDANAWLTLAPAAPQGLSFSTAASWYQPFTRFGRHGDLAVHSGRPFKSPLLMTDTAAILTPAPWVPGKTFIGQGLGGDGSLSKAIGKTVHQGYAPVLQVRLEETQ